MKKKKERLVPYNMVSPGFEAIYTGRKASSESEKVEMITTVIADETGNEIRKWPVVSWTFPGEEKDWDEEIKYINNMQSKLGELDDSTRQIRSHIASLVPCDSGFPVTVDELLNAIGKGKLDEPSFRNGCWCSDMWWKQKTTQPSHIESMRIIHTVLTGYLASEPKDGFIREFPGTAGFINRTYAWLGPATELTEVQKLIMERMLLTIEYFSKTSDTVPYSQFDDISKLQEGERHVKELFEEGGQGANLDMEISKKAALPRVYPKWKPEYQENLESLEDSRKKELYKTCCSIAVVKKRKNEVI
ncbi:hypothetical protein ES703_91388 [subsurface metagenome]